MASSDEEQTTYARVQGRVIFTQDKDFLRLNAARVPHAGIVYCRQGKLSIGGIIRGLTEIWEIMEPEEMHNWLLYL
jgi:predicted nuclease of predicted toxin-antitoxin system